MTSLLLHNIVKCFDQTETIHQVNLDIQSGEFIVLVGPSGCGKSTILRMIAGLEEVTSGTIQIGDKDITHLPASKRGIAMVFQSYALYPHMTVKENFSFGLKNMKCSSSFIEQQIQYAADTLQLGEFLDRLPAQLSGGQRQRVAIGRAIVRDPEIFLFDEPLSNLDADLRVQMRHELSKLHKQLKTTMLYVTHDQTEAMTMADRIVIVDQGNIVQVGAPLELYNHPDNLFTASFIGSPKINLLPGKIKSVKNDQLVVNLFEQQDVSINLPAKDLKEGDEVTLGIRPEHLYQNSQGSDLSFNLQLSAVESLGDATYIYAKIFDKLDFRVKLQGQQTFDSIQHLSVYIAPSKLLLFDAEGKAIR